jgi:hypothetical protein
MVTEQQIDAFSQFAKSQIGSGASADSLVELLDQWLLENPPQSDLLAIEASLRDMEAGETGKPFAEFAAEFRARNGLPNSR